MRLHLSLEDKPCASSEVDALPFQIYVCECIRVMLESNLAVVFTSLGSDLSIASVKDKTDGCTAFASVVDFVRL